MAAKAEVRGLAAPGWHAIRPFPQHGVHLMKIAPRVFSGMQPTGSLHLGNYLGAMVNWIELQKSHECIYCVVDMHAITVWQDPDELKNAIRQVTATYIASGLDPKRSILFNQSEVTAHAELAWIFNCVARLGWLNRMTQFKEKAGKDRENASVGLYAYPNLMAADILAYRATHVPVGDDQKQHLELARDIAQKFNNDFEPWIDEGGPRRRRLLPAARAGHHGPGDARHEPARRYEEDVEVGPFRSVAHQHDGRRRHHRQEDPEGEDRSRAAPERGEGPRWASGSREPRRHLRGACGQVEGRGPGRFGGAQFSAFKKVARGAVQPRAWSHRGGPKRLMSDPSEIDPILADGAARARALASRCMTR